LHGYKKQICNFSDLISTHIFYGIKIVGRFLLFVAGGKEKKLLKKGEIL